MSHQCITQSPIFSLHILGSVFRVDQSFLVFRSGTVGAVLVYWSLLLFLSLAASLVRLSGRFRYVQIFLHITLQVCSYSVHFEYMAERRIFTCGASRLPTVGGEVVVVAQGQEGVWQCFGDRTDVVLSCHRRVICPHKQSATGVTLPHLGSLQVSVWCGPLVPKHHLDFSSILVPSCKPYRNPSADHPDSMYRCSIRARCRINRYYTLCSDFFRASDRHEAIDRTPNVVSSFTSPPVSPVTWATGQRGPSDHYSTRGYIM